MTPDAPSSSAAVGVRQLVAVPDFRRLWIAQIVSDFGDSLTFITLLFLVQRLTGSTVALAGLAISITIPSLLFGVVSGVFVDRWDRRKVMLVSDVLRGVVVLGLVFVRSADSVWLAYALAFTHAAIATLFDPAKSALLPSLVGKDNLLAANSVSQTSEVVAGLAGTAVAGLLAASLVDLWPVFVLDAGTFLLSAYFISRIAVRSEDKQAEVPKSGAGVWEEMVEGFRVISGSRPLMGVVVSGAIAMLGLGTINVLMVPLIIDDLAVSESWFGLIQGSQVVGMVTAGIIVAVLAARFSESRLIVGGLIAVGMMIAAISRVTSVWQLMVILTVIGLAVVPVGAAAGTLVQTLVPDELRGRVGSSMETVTSTASVISMGFAGVVAASIGTRSVFAISGAITIAAGVVAWFMFRGTDE
ncbi:MAG: MFS transporter [Actinobacteria bacterium]|nr:MFS transporter [Actinomycetota bacterium]